MRPDLTKAQLLEGPQTTVEGSTVEVLPITADELRAHLWTIYPEKNTDAYVELIIRAATSHIETITWRKLITQKWRIYLDEWPAGGIHLPFGHIQSVEAVRYLDIDATDTELTATDDYIPAIVGPMPMVVPSSSGWPSASLYEVDPIRVDFTCGFGDPAEVPADLRHAIQLLAAHWYETREAVIVGTTVRKVPFAVDALVAPWKVRRA